MIAGAVVALTVASLSPSFVTRRRLSRVGTTIGTPILTGLVVSLGVLAIQLYFDGQARERDERRSLQVELGRDAELVGADLASRDLAGFFLQGKTFTKANLARANLARANLRNAELIGADLAHADLTHADLTSAGLRYARLDGADLTRARLELARLPQVRARRARFVRANLVLAWMPADLRGAYFNAAELVNADLGGANLEGAQFVGADLDGTSFRGALLAGANFRGTRNIDLADFFLATYDSTTRWPRSGARPKGVDQCTRRTCTVLESAAHSFRRISPRLARLGRLLKTEWLPTGWEPREDRTGFTFTAPLAAAEVTGENHADIATGETLEAFASSLRPADLESLADEWTGRVRIRGNLAACVRGFTWSDGDVRRKAIELMFLDGSFGFLFSAKAEAASFHLYDHEFGDFFAKLGVTPNPLTFQPARVRACR